MTEKEDFLQNVEKIYNSIQHTIASNVDKFQKAKEIERLEKDFLKKDEYVQKMFNDYISSRVIKIDEKKEIAVLANKIKEKYLTKINSIRREI